jgi:hypothetical protein
MDTADDGARNADQPRSGSYSEILANYVRLRREGGQELILGILIGRARRLLESFDDEL